MPTRMGKWIRFSITLIRVSLKKLKRIVKIPASSIGMKNLMLMARLSRPKLMKTVTGR